MSALTDEALDQRLWAEIRLQALPRSRKDAIAQGASHYFTGQPCANWHYAERNTRSKACVECQRHYWRRYHQTHRAERLAASREYRRLHRDELNFKRKLFYVYGTTKIDECKMLALPPPQTTTR